MTNAIITADRLFDGTGSPALLRPVVRIADGQITAVDGSLMQAADCSGERIDFPGCTILPGLIDTHVHLIMSGLDTREAIIAQVTGETDDQLHERALANAKAALHTGLTTVRDCGGRGSIIQSVRNEIRDGKAEGCDVISCGAPITTTTGHCHWFGRIADSTDDVRRACEQMLAEDADFLKVMATGGNMTASSDPMIAQYDDETLKLIADMGRREGKHSAAHVLSRVALPGVVKANYRTIEHCDWRVEEFRYDFSPELARRMIDQDQYAGLTMSGVTRRVFVPPPDDFPGGIVQRLNMRFECERKMIDFGIRFTIHSDAGVPRTPIDKFAFGLRAAEKELRLTPADVLRAVTESAAQALSLDDRGTLQIGKRADLLIVEGNPLHDMAALHNVRGVMKAGQWAVKRLQPTEPMV